MEEQNTNAEVIPAVPSILPEMSPGQKRQCERSLDELEDAKKLKPELPEDNVPVQEPGSGNRKIFIGNLPASVVEAGLVAYFRTFGNVIDCKVVRDRDAGISRGFAFLTCTYTFKIRDRRGAPRKCILFFKVYVGVYLSVSAYASAVFFKVFPLRKISVKPILKKILANQKIYYFPFPELKKNSVKLT